MARWILIVAVLLAAIATWWLWPRNPYLGHWANLSAAHDTLDITRQGEHFLVKPAGSSALLMKLEEDRLIPLEFGSTLLLIHDAQTDQLRYPVFSDVVRIYGRVR